MAVRNTRHPFRRKPRAADPPAAADVATEPQSTAARCAEPEPMSPDPKPPATALSAGQVGSGEAFWKAAGVFHRLR